ncbi:MAG: TonB-dependent receptor, partial [Balneolaceae bacterium]
TDAFGFRPVRMPNEDLSWETTSTFNAGVDYEILSGRVTGSLELYHSRTSDLLLLRQIPWTSGYGSIMTNVGVKTNQGFEFSVSAHTIAPDSPGGISWTTDFNIFTNKEKIVELAQGKVDDIGNRRFIGQPANVFYDFEKVGIWQVGQEEEAAANNSMVGGVRVASPDPEDRVIVGTDVPSIITGMTNRFAYRGFDLSIVANARFGHTIQSAFHGGGIFHSGRGNHLVTDYWTEDNPDAEFPRPHGGLQQPYYYTTLRYFDGSFIKIRAINFGYNFGTEITERLGVRSLRLFVNATNPFVFSEYVQKYHGTDPETSMDPIPQATTIMGGWNISF